MTKVVKYTITVEIEAQVYDLGTPEDIIKDHFDTAFEIFDGMDQNNDGIEITVNSIDIKQTC